MIFPSANIPDLNAKEIKPYWDIDENNIPNTLLILGNGFDIDLGIKTKYIDFADSKYWPFKENLCFEEDSLPYFLNDSKYQVNTWFDLEELLAVYASQKTDLSKEKIKKQKEYLTILTKSLNNYLVEQENDYIKKMEESKGKPQRRKPSQYLVDIFRKKEIRKIYTFNYTNTFRLINTFSLNFKDEIYHVHGSTKEDNIILGTGDHRKINEEYFEFYKSASPLYQSNNLVEDLDDADEVYIFGHSLGENDHDYFSDFFKKISQSVHRPFSPGKIKVRIFTYDDKSEIDIKRQLMKLTDKHLIGLYAHCDFKILKTALEHQTLWMNNKEML